MHLQGFVGFPEKCEQTLQSDLCPAKLSQWSQCMHTYYIIVVLKFLQLCSSKLWVASNCIYKVIVIV